MRVIAGTYRSRPLAAPKGMETRPTSDRLRETLFNVLAPRMEGSAFLDPPYAETDAYQSILQLLGGECVALLAPEAIVIAEHQKKFHLAESYGALSRYRLLKQGDTALSFFRAI